jgi:hypothetical protein
VLTNPNIFLAGQIGRGKSMLAKSLAARGVAFGRRVYVPGDHPSGNRERRSMSDRLSVREELVLATAIDRLRDEPISHRGMRGFCRALDAIPVNERTLYGEQAKLEEDVEDALDLLDDALVGPAQLVPVVPRSEFLDHMAVSPIMNRRLTPHQE